jgi:hypothetical protein
MTRVRVTVSFVLTPKPNKSRKPGFAAPPRLIDSGRLWNGQLIIRIIRIRFALLLYKLPERPCIRHCLRSAAVRNEPDGQVLKSVTGRKVGDGPDPAAGRRRRNP